MGARYVIAALSALFFVLAALRLARDGSTLHPQSRAWLIVGVIFAVVSAYLFSQE
jgi:hypothetical protein